MPEQVKIGVALGSGAAKGWAHIGVLRALAELGIAPQVVAGCSIGAFVGAAYAAGKLAALEEWVLSFSSWDVVGLMDLSWRRGGLIEGDKVFEIGGQAIGLNHLDQLTMPFMAVATDLYTGQEVWLDQGELTENIRASCSIPGLMLPKKIGDRYLVDGAVVNPVPVSACRALGADMVIAVDLHGDSRQHQDGVVRMDTPVPEAQKSRQSVDSGFMDFLISGRDVLSRLKRSFSSEHPSSVAVMHQAMAILEQRHKRSRLVGDPPDAVVLPRVGQIATMEFQRASEAIAAGEAAVARVADQLEAERERYQKGRNGH